MKESWLITGGAGFIGTNFVRLAASHKNICLIILDSLTYAGNLENIQDLLSFDHIHFVKGDIGDRDLVQKLFKDKKIDKVIHFAAESHVDRSILGPYPFIKTNIEGTFHLLECARSSWQDEKGHLFLHISTDEVFGALQPNDPPFSEKSSYQPNSPYSASKASADHLVRAWGHTFGLPVIVANCSNNYGPWQFPEKLIPLTILNALEGREIPVYGDGLQVRDWIHVEDHCKALLLILEKGRKGETYLVGANNQMANIDVVEKVCDLVDDLSGQPLGASRQRIRHITDRRGHDRRYTIDSSKIKKELGWKPVYSFDKGLRHTVQWYFENKEWARGVRSGEYQKYYQEQYGSK